MEEKKMREQTAAEDKESKKSRKKTIWTAVIVGILLVLITIAVIPLTKALATAEGREHILLAIDQMGAFKYLIYFLLQVAQIVIAIIPGGPIPLLGSILFGKWVTLLLSVAGCFCGTALVYCLVQAIGRPIVNLFVSEEQLQTYKFLQNPKRLEWIIFLVFLCPGLPKDALTYIASLTTVIKPMRLFWITTAARTPAIIATIWLGDSLWNGHYVRGIVLVAIMVVAVVAGYFIKRQIDKRHKPKKQEQKGKEES